MQNLKNKKSSIEQDKELLYILRGYIYRLVIRKHYQEFVVQKCAECSETYGKQFLSFWDMIIFFLLKYLESSSILTKTTNLFH